MKSLPTKSSLPTGSILRCWWTSLLVLALVQSPRLMRKQRSQEYRFRHETATANAMYNALAGGTSSLSAPPTAKQGGSVIKDESRNAFSFRVLLPGYMYGYVPTAPAPPLLRHALAHCQSEPRLSHSTTPFAPRRGTPYPHWWRPMRIMRFVH